ncbi:hypothetical protein [Paludibacterium denitrificans]|uniref:Uncharacterized protein n=1 Tax=Paludibacterium denitrificans TaxID=2675226 RepID=A0A844GA33_9NEIS|nr:hypothetical protein [Paludibacterium denitrificans]MTD32642.1 hypothetical protein [Paludibacterium denitrificans]
MMTKPVKLGFFGGLITGRKTDGTGTFIRQIDGKNFPCSSLSSYAPFSPKIVDGVVTGGGVPAYINEIEIPNAPHNVDQARQTVWGSGPTLGVYTNKTLFCNWLDYVGWLVPIGLGEVIWVALPGGCGMASQIGHDKAPAITITYTGDEPPAKPKWVTASKDGRKAVLFGDNAFYDVAVNVIKLTGVVNSGTTSTVRYEVTMTLTKETRINTIIGHIIAKNSGIITPVTIRGYLQDPQKIDSVTLNDYADYGGELWRSYDVYRVHDRADYLIGGDVFVSFETERVGLSLLPELTHENAINMTRDSYMQTKDYYNTLVTASVLGNQVFNKEKFPYTSEMDVNVNVVPGNVIDIRIREYDPIVVALYDRSVIFMNGETRTVYDDSNTIKKGSNPTNLRAVSPDKIYLSDDPKDMSCFFV